MRATITTITEIVGVGVIVFGVSMFNHAAAVIVAGVCMVAAGAVSA